MDSRTRSLVKALTWRGVALTVTATVAWIATGELEMAAAIGAADEAIKFVLYYLHERVWGQVAFGRPQEDYQI